jgi:NAD(P)H-hydrate epimerase
MIVVSAEQMREMDRLTIRGGVPSLVLMERAGAAVAQAIIENFAAAAKNGVLIVAGKGNNGGDGFVVARLLKKRRFACEVALLARRAELSADAAHNCRAFEKARGKVVEITPQTVGLLQNKIDRTGLLVDAILGTGINSEVRGLYAEAIAAMNASGLPVVAVDIPSGLQTDRGTPLGIAIQAELTVALGYPKLGEVIYPGVDFVGSMAVADIGIDDAAVAEVAPDTEILTPEEIGWLVPRRHGDTHKGTYGHLLVVAGSRGKTGAAVLTCRAALRSGAGLVTLAAPGSLNSIFAAALIESMTEPLGETDAGEMGEVSPGEWSGLLERKSALVFGPGIGVNDATRNSMRWLLRHLDMPWVIDADGLNNLALDIERLKQARTAPVLTPHPGEMARLLGNTTTDINQNRVGSARDFATEHRCYLVLKGARSVIATPQGKVYINPTGNPGMASGGMGDALAGILGALLAQGLAPQDALRLGVFAHGFIGDRVADKKGESGLVASDIIDGLPAGLRALSMPPC